MQPLCRLQRGYRQQSPLSSGIPGSIPGGSLTQSCNQRGPSWRRIGACFLSFVIGAGRIKAPGELLSGQAGTPLCQGGATPVCNRIQGQGETDKQLLHLPHHAATMDARLLAGMQGLRDLKAVGDVRGLGLLVAVELVAERATKAVFDPAKKVIGRVRAELEAREVFTRNMRDILAFAPPLVITAAQADKLVDSTRGCHDPLRTLGHAPRVRSPEKTRWPLDGGD